MSLEKRRSEGLLPGKGTLTFEESSCHPEENRNQPSLVQGTELREKLLDVQVGASPFKEGRLNN